MVGNHSPKQLKRFHFGRNDNEVKNCFALYPEKCSLSNRKKRWKRRLAPWRKGSKIWRHPTKFWIPHFPPGLRQFFHSRLLYVRSFVGGANSAAVTRAQSVLRSTPWTTWKFEESLRARDNNPADKISQACLPYFDDPNNCKHFCSQR